MVMTAIVSAPFFHLEWSTIETTWLVRCSLLYDQYTPVGKWLPVARHARMPSAGIQWRGKHELPIVTLDAR
jgi:hypothetical protein